MWNIAGYDVWMCVRLKTLAYRIVWHFPCLLLGALKICRWAIVFKNCKQWGLPKSNKDIISGKTQLINFVKLMTIHIAKWWKIHDLPNFHKSKWFLFGSLSDFWELWRAVIYCRWDPWHPFYDELWRATDTLEQSIDFCIDVHSIPYSWRYEEEHLCVKPT